MININKTNISISKNNININNININDIYKNINTIKIHDTSLIKKNKIYDDFEIKKKIEIEGERKVIELLKGFPF